MKKTFLLMLTVLIAIGCAQKPPLPEDYKGKIREYYKAEKLDSALILIDRVLAEKKDLENKEVVSLLRGKFSYLMKLKKYQEALPVAKEVVEKVERKSPYRSLSVAECYLHLNKEKEAMEWINKAVDLGFKSTSYLDTPPFDKIKNSENYSELEKRIFDNIGIGKTPKDFTLTSIEGNEISLSKLKGKVVLIDFWATWCPPCRAEIPHLVEYYNELNKKGFEILGVSLDQKDDLENLKKFVSEKGMKWPIFYSGQYWSDDTARMYGVNSIPSTWLIDKKGILRYFNIKGEEVKNKVKELLAEK